MTTDWIQSAVDKMKAKNTAGSFSAAASRAGSTTKAFAKQQIDSPSATPGMKKKANFALNAIGSRLKNKVKPA